MVIYVLDPFNCIIFKNSFYGIRIKKGKIIIAGMGSEGRGKYQVDKYKKFV